MKYRFVILIFLIFKLTTAYCQKEKNVLSKHELLGSNYYMVNDSLFEPGIEEGTIDFEIEFKRIKIFENRNLIKIRGILKINEEVIPYPQIIIGQRKGENIKINRCVFGKKNGLFLIKSEIDKNSLLIIYSASYKPRIFKLYELLSE
jgi:hypothetical protein